MYLKIKNNLEDEFSTSSFYIIYKDTNGNMENYASIDKRYLIPSKFTIETNCIKFYDYKNFVKKLKKRKLIDKKLNNIEKYIEISIAELYIDRTNIELNLLAKD